MASFTALPAEVLCEIAEMSTWGHHPFFDSFGHPSYAQPHSSLARTCRRFYNVLNPSLYRRNISFDAVLNSCVLWAAERGRVGTMRIAKELGANLDVITGRDVSAKGWNGIPGRMEIVTTPLHLAVQNGHRDVIEYLVTHGAGVHLPAPHGCSCPPRRIAEPFALHVAIEHSILAEAGVLLIQHGAYLVQAGEAAFEPSYHRGRHDLVQLLLEQRSPEKTTEALRFALATHQTPLALKLIARPELDPSKLFRSESLLQFAVALGREDEVCVMLTRDDVSPTRLEGNGQSALHYSPCYANTSILEALLTIQPDVNVNIVDAKGWTPLHHAARWNNIPAMKVLMRHLHKDTNIRDKQGKTPLHVAGLFGMCDAVRLLLKQPAACPGALTYSGLNVLHCLAAAGTEDDEDKDSDNEDSGDDESTLTEQEYEGVFDMENFAQFEQMIRQIVDTGIDVNQVSPTAGTAFRIAARRLNFHMALALLNVGCDPNIGLDSVSGWTNLHDCLRSRADTPIQTEVVKALIGHGVDVDSRNEYDAEFSTLAQDGSPIEVCHGGTPLFFAGGYAQDLDCMKVLLDAGADPNARIFNFHKSDPSQGTLFAQPLLVALQWQLSSHGNSLDGAFGQLVKHGAILDSPGDDQMTALEHACRAGASSSHLVQELLDSATGDSVSQKHVQVLIDEYGSDTGRVDPGMQDLARILTEFKDRIWKRE